MKLSNINQPDAKSLAIDLGGTKILIGEVDIYGKIINSKKYSSDVYENSFSMDSITKAIDDYLVYSGGKIKDFKAIGIGTVGRVNHSKGLWYEIDPSRILNIPVSKIFQEKYGLPSTIDNDVRCAVAAENKLGYGGKSNNYIYINIGTGIAAGFVVNGELIRGASYNAGEIGHQVVYKNSDIECLCGRKGCVETIASGMGMDERARKLKANFIHSNLTIPLNSRCNVEEIFTLADAGDDLCSLITEEAADAIACLIMNLVRVTDPDTIVLGGGIVSDGWLLPKIKAKLNSKTMRFVKNGVVLTELNADYIGLIGAGLLAHEKFNLMDGDK